jgi:hypothetical protein
LASRLRESGFASSGKLSHATTQASPAFILAALLVSMLGCASKPQEVARSIKGEVGKE